MKVLQHTSEQLTIQERLIGIWLLSLGSICSGLFMFFLFEPPVDWVGAFCIALGCTFVTLAPTETLTFDREKGSLLIFQGRYLKRRTVHLPIAQITAVDVEAFEIAGFRFYQINLKSATGKKLTVTRTLSTDLQQQRTVVDHIQDFLNRPRDLQNEALQPASPRSPHSA